MAQPDARLPRPITLPGKLDSWDGERERSSVVEFGASLLTSILPQPANSKARRPSRSFRTQSDARQVASSGEEALTLADEALAKGEVLAAVHQCHSGIELVEAALVQPDVTDADAAELRATRATLEARLLELESAELAQENRLFHLPDYLVGVGFPGNPIADGVTVGEVGIKLRSPAGGGIGGYCVGAVSQLWQSLRQGAYVRSEWCGRVALSTCVSMVIALDATGLSPPILVDSGWLVVLATAQCKPTLGDALEGSWIAVSGACLGLLSALPLMPLAVSSPAAACVAMFASQACIVYFLGDHVQARWAMLCSLMGHLAAAKTQSAWGMAGAMGELVVGFIAGCSCAVLMLLLPFARLASDQLSVRLAETHRQVMRYHAVLLLAFVQLETPNVLLSRSDRLAAMVRTSLTNLSNLVKVSRWETFLLRSIDNRMLASHVSLLSDLAHNLQRRNGNKSNFDRAAPGHRALASASAPRVHQIIRHAAQWQRALLMPLVTDAEGAVYPMDEEAKLKHHARFEQCFSELMSSWYDSYADVILNTKRPKISTWSTGSSANLSHIEQLMLIAQFHTTLLNDTGSAVVTSDPACDSESDASPRRPPLIEVLFPGAFEEVGRRARIQLALRTAVTMLVVTALPWVPWLAGAPDDATLSNVAGFGVNASTSGAITWGPVKLWSPPDLLRDFSVFSPICVVFVYQDRQISNIAESSRLWRFVFGTLIGCVWSLWTVGLFGHALAPLVISCSLAAAAGTYIHALRYFGYGGLVLAFTTPLICSASHALFCLQYWGAGHERIEQRPIARILQTVTGAAICAGITLLWPSEYLRAQSVLQDHLAKCLRRVRHDFAWFAEAREHDPDLAAAGRFAHRQSCMMRELLKEASLEPSIYSRPPLPYSDLAGVLYSLESAQQAWLRMLHAVDVMRQRDGQDTASLSSPEVAKVPSLDEISARQGDDLLLRLLRHATTKLELLDEVLEHMVHVIEPEPTVDLDGASALPPSLGMLQAETHSAWLLFDDEWTPLLAKELRKRNGSDHYHAVGSFLSWLVTAQSIVELDRLCRHISHAAERLANVVLKQQPSIALLPKPTDLYKFEVEV
ncbi:hypothetical protein AB1Y20_002865 [Prymnesium parvum]|uniref:DUF2421 domain-containing protein n=1 Tax=Prymnesium parvum TaxID=97485 RepID=A0AB34JBU1_PRYPA